MIYEVIKGLVQYGLDIGLISEVDAVCARNRILNAMKMDEYQEPTEDAAANSLEDTLKALTDHAHETGALEDGSIVYRNSSGTKLMNCLIPRLSEVVRKSQDHYKVSPEKATNWYYRLSQGSDHICRYRIVEDVKWTAKTQYGTLDITVDPFKPKRDPRAIATARLTKQSGYPKCQLCMENVGYVGRTNRPVRDNRRIILVTINDSQWGFQYFPYAYYNKHYIILNGQHIPVKIDRTAFRKLFDFIKQPPHYFLDSNADLSIVGDSTLSHNHSQGGHYAFAMAGATIKKHSTLEGSEDMEAGIVF